MDFKQSIMEVGIITKAATFKSFLQLIIKTNKNLSRWFLGGTQKYELRVSFKRLMSYFIHIYSSFYFKRIWKTISTGEMERRYYKETEKLKTIRSLKTIEMKEIL